MITTGTRSNLDIMIVLERSAELFMKIKIAKSIPSITKLYLHGYLRSCRLAIISYLKLQKPLIICSANRICEEKVSSF